MSCKTCQIRTSAEFRARSAAHIGRAQASMATASSFMHIGDRISLFHEQTNGYLGAEGFSNMQVTNQDNPPMGHLAVATRQLAEACRGWRPP